MRIALLFALLLGVAHAAPPAPVNTPEALKVMEGVQVFYASVQDLKASFTQTYTYEVYGRKQVSSGTVFFKKPGRMRWDYKAPKPKVFVSDGQVLWVYEPEEAQAFKRSLSDAQLPVALTFMSGKGRLADEFDARLLPAKGGSTWLELVPKRDEGHYRSVRLEVDAKTFQVKASTVVDPVGNTNLVTFSGMQTNTNLPDAGFRFTPPAGVRIINGPAPQSPTP